MTWFGLTRGIGALGVALAAAFAAKTMAPRVSPGTLAAAGGFVQSPGAAVLAARRWAEEQSLSGDLQVVQGAETAPESTAQPEYPAESAVSVIESAPIAAPTPLPQEEWDGVLPEGAMPVKEETFLQGSGEGYVAAGVGSIKNVTAVSDAAVAEDISMGLPFGVQVGTAEPQVLIMHTHTTETYLTESAYYAPEGWSGRTTEETQNVCAVGDAMADALNAAGICTLHDKTLHDYPSYNGSYAASNKTVRQYLAAYPGIKVVLDVHRDAIEREGALVAPVAAVEGERTAQVMIICGCDKNGNLPNCMENLRFAAAWEAGMESRFPGLTRPVLFDYRYYNQDLTTGSLLIEVGGHGNTLEEAVRAGAFAGRALAEVLGGTT